MSCMSASSVPSLPLSFSLSLSLSLSLALGKMEELLMEMKSDVSRLPGELSKIASVSNQLKMDEISSLSKLARKQGESRSSAPSVITQATPTTTTAATAALPMPTSQAGAGGVAGGVAPARLDQMEHMMIVQEKVGGVSGELMLVDQSRQPAGQYPVAYTTPGGALVQAVYPATSTGVQVAASTAVQPSDGMIVVANSNGSQFAASVAPSSDSSHSGTGQQVQGAYAINMPTYVDLQGQTVQLVPVSGQSVQLAAGQSVQLASGQLGSGQQLVYLPGVMQGSGLAVGSQLAMVSGGSQAILQPLQYTTTSGTTPSTRSSNVITID